MEWFEYLIIVAVVLFVGSVTFVAIRNKIKGKSSCGCGGNCSGCNKCCNAKQHLEEYLKSK
ncbi:MAG: FeoB-associated Cys-rich membrane protein [Erysipelotrichaceae bacterium]|nr:FeoB-associated Cys-rich membrane protein [Erysipelotrichaceae bacterium]